MASGTGTVYLVGAGPGDPDLLTVRGDRLLREADLVCYDSLVGDGVLERIGTDVRAVDVGKETTTGESVTQAEINELLVDEATAGRTVVRLKGGDPFVFGRGGEELEHLAANDVPVEVIPGVTSAIAAPGSVGVPVTHRDHASSVSIVTAHEDSTNPESALDWDVLSRTIGAGGTLVILMGVRRLPSNMAALREHGVAADTPVAVIERATCEGETAVSGTLADIVDRARDTDVKPPAVTVVGDVVEVGQSVAAILDGSTAGLEFETSGTDIPTLAADSND